ncbi:EPIDERMAL PATTERNING FACTOR-like protein 2 [Linum grandiflorum]
MINILQFRFSFLFLLLSSFTLLTCQTRAVTKLLEAPQKGVGEMMVRRSGTIGSRPPKCDDVRCHSCGQCVAVQVPVTVQAQISNRLTHDVGSVPTSAYNRGGEDFSNYKPMSWKCKCGSFIFNP